MPTETTTETTSRKALIIAALAKNILGIYDLDASDEIGSEVTSGQIREALLAAYDQGRAGALEQLREAAREGRRNARRSALLLAAGGAA